MKLMGNIQNFFAAHFCPFRIYSIKKVQSELKVTWNDSFLYMIMLPHLHIVLLFQFILKYVLLPPF